MAAPLAFLFAVMAPLRADITLPAPAPPQADALTIRVVRGESATIPLRAHYGGGGTVSFAIGQLPGHGELSQLRLLGDNRATILYRNDGAASVARDSFSYVVKSSDRVSSPAEVTIFVDEPPARMRLPDRLEFAEIMAGERETRSFKIANAGGGLLEGRLTVSAPWALAEANYRVVAGGTQATEVEFRPNEARSFVGQITLFGADGSQKSIPLLGSASAPVAIEPAALRISLPQNKLEPRRGEIALTNRTKDRLSLQVEASSRIRPVSELVLGPQETRKVAIGIIADRTVPVREEIAIVGPGFRLPVALEAEAEPAPPKPIEAAVSPIAPPRTSVPPPSTAPATSSRQTSTFAMTSSTPLPVSYVAIHAQRLDSSGWELRWKQPPDPVANYRIEERFLSFDGKSELQITWRALDKPAISSAGDEVVARISGLDREQLHMLRVTALGPGGATLWESPLVALAPPRAPSQGGRGWLLLFAVALVVLVAVRWRAHRT